ncbi:hypothetical protein BA190_27655 [Labrys sp. WJW]|uniref:hypothetical protein n=1 Tax=Labrys sp. WJW TaxID=1737983 RepID=UPI000834A32D|nr:hypothetical protein [Labrys sp. WJW]OCC01740.1 hypothetical protein BA190_27655 [Labrys sp. WJW]
MAGKITKIVRDAVAQGLTNGEIIAAHPELNPSSIRALAARVRNRPESFRVIHVRSGPGVKLPVHLAQALDVEASGRPDCRGGNDLLRKLVDVIVRDDLFDAVLGEQ